MRTGTVKRLSLDRSHGLVRAIGIAAILLLVASASTAQIVLDGTLRPENAGVVPPDLSGPNDPARYRIDQTLGIVSDNGANLLHSFSDFGLVDGESATFAGDATIQNVIARVTGQTESLIEGVLRSEVGAANFFFVNPNGITFRNIREDDQQNKIEVPGSFFASTADALVFSEGETFSANGVGGTPANTILSAPDAWQFLGGGAAPIEIDQTLPLGVSDGATLSLTAGDLQVHRAASVQASGGTIAFAAVGGAATNVPLALADWVVPDSVLGEIVVEEDSTLRTDAVAGGSIVLRGGRLVVDGLSRLTSSGDGAAGVSALDLELNESILIDEATVRSTNASPTGAGAVSVRTGELLIVNGGVLLTRTGNGDAGDFRVETDRIDLDSGGRIESLALIGGGAGADIVVSANLVEIAGGGQIAARSTSAGQAGDVTIAAIDGVELTGRGSSIASSSEPRSTGAGGDVTIAGSLDGLTATGRLIVEDSAQIEAVTVTDADGGSLSIRAEQVRIVGPVDPMGGSGAGPGVLDPSGLFARTGRSAEPDAPIGNGEAGMITIDSDQLTLVGAAEVSARSFGTGRSGRIDIRSRDSVLLQGGADGVPVVSIRAIDGDAGGSTTGEPGLAVKTERLELLDGGALIASTIGAGDAGDILVEAGSVLIQGATDGTGSSIFSEAGSPSTDAGDSGRIELRVRDDFQLDEGARLSVRTQGSGASDRIDVTVGGDLRIGTGSQIRSLAEGTGAAGDLNIDAVGSVEIAGDAEVTAESFGSADAGNIRIVAGESLTSQGGRIATAASSAAGGSIAIQAGSLIALDRTAVVTSVQGRDGEGDAGNLELSAQEITLNESQVLAQAVLGDGGQIRIESDRFIQSADSLVDASSSSGIDGVIQIDAPVTSLRGELAKLPGSIIDPSAFLRATCAARAQNSGSFVILDSAGPRRTPIEAGSMEMPIPSQTLRAPSARIEERSDPEGFSFSLLSPTHLRADGGVFTTCPRFEADRF